MFFSAALTFVLLFFTSTMAMESDSSLIPSKAVSAQKTTEIKSIIELYRQNPVLQMQDIQESLNRNFEGTAPLSRAYHSAKDLFHTGNRQAFDILKESVSEEKVFRIMEGMISMEASLRELRKASENKNIDPKFIYFLGRGASILLSQALCKNTFINMDLSQKLYSKIGSLVSDEDILREINKACTTQYEKFLAQKEETYNYFYPIVLPSRLGLFTPEVGVYALGQGVVLFSLVDMPMEVHGGQYSCPYSIYEHDNMHHDSLTQLNQGREIFEAYKALASKLYQTIKEGTCKENQSRYFYAAFLSLHDTFARDYIEALDDFLKKEGLFLKDLEALYKSYLCATYDRFLVEFQLTPSWSFKELLPFQERYLETKKQFKKNKTLSFDEKIEKSRRKRDDLDIADPDYPKNHGFLSGYMSGLQIIKDWALKDISKIDQTFQICEQVKKGQEPKVIPDHINPPFPLYQAYDHVQVIWMFKKQILTPAESIDLENRLFIGLEKAKSNLKQEIWQGKLAKAHEQTENSFSLAHEAAQKTPAYQTYIYRLHHYKAHNYDKRIAFELFRELMMDFNHTISQLLFTPPPSRMTHII